MCGAHCLDFRCGSQTGSWHAATCPAAGKTLILAETRTIILRVLRWNSYYYEVKHSLAATVISVEYVYPYPN